MSCVVVIKTKTKIIAGADSKRTLHIFAPDGKVSTKIENNYQKIHKVNNIFFALAGFNDGTQLELATELCKEAKSLQEAANSFGKKMKFIHEDVIESRRVDNKEWFKERFLDHDIGSSSFFGMRNGTPSIVTLTFRTMNSENETTKVSYRETRDEIFTILGIRDHIPDPDDNFKQKLIVDNDVSIMSRIQSIIKHEMSYNPDKIGEPIKYLILDKSNETWI